MALQFPGFAKFEHRPPNCRPPGSLASPEGQSGTSRGVGNEPFGESLKGIHGGVVYRGQSLQYGGEKRKQLIPHFNPKGSELAVRGFLLACFCQLPKMPRLKQAPNLASRESRRDTAGASPSCRRLPVHSSWIGNVLRPVLTFRVDGPK